MVSILMYPVLYFEYFFLEKEKNYYTIPMQGALAINLKNGISSDSFDWDASGTLPIERSGDPGKTLDYYMRNKTCVSQKTTDELFADLPGKGRYEKISYLQLLVEDGEEARKLYLAYQAKEKGKNAQAVALLESQFRQQYSKILKGLKTEKGEACFKKGTLTQFLDEYMKTALSSTNSMDHILKALFASCEKKSAPVTNLKRIPIVQGGLGVSVTDKNNIMKDTEAQAAATIHQALSGKFNHPTQPIIFSICDNFLSDGKASNGVIRKSNGSIDLHSLPALIYEERCKPHTIVVVGRKTQGNQCQILLRDSAKKCKSIGYSKDWKCDEQGDDLWVDQETLIHNTLNYTFFKD